MIGFPNNIDSSTLSGGSFASGLPLTNTQTRQLKEVARTANTAKTSTFVNIDLGSAKATRVLAVANHNLSLAAKYRVRGSSEGTAVKCLPGNDDLTNLQFGGWSPFASGGGVATVQAMVDPVVGTYFRITKTAGEPGDWAGIQNTNVAMLSGKLYSVGCWVRRGSTTATGYMPNVDTIGTLGLLSAPNVINAATAPSVGVWTKVTTANNNAYGESNIMTGTGTAYLWVDSNVGDYIDVKLPDIEMGTSATSSAVAVPWGAAPYTRPAGIMDSWQSYTCDSGWLDVWPAVYPFGTKQWEDPNWWGGKYSQEEITGFTATLTHVLPLNQTCRYWRIDFDDTTNSAGYVQWGRIFIGPVWQPAVNMSWGASLAWETDTEVGKSLSGSESFDYKQPYRVSRYKLEAMSRDEGLANAYELQRRAGIDKEVMWVEDPDATFHALRTRFLGRLRTLSPIEYPYFDNNVTAFEIKELQ
jgi:hypothetical protein